MEAHEIGYGLFLGYHFAAHDAAREHLKVALNFCASAVLALIGAAKVRRKKPSAKTLAESLGLSMADITMALDTLRKAGAIRQVSGRYPSYVLEKTGEAILCAAWGNISGKLVDCIKACSPTTEKTTNKDSKARAE